MMPLNDKVVVWNSSKTGHAAILFLRPGESIEGAITITHEHGYPPTGPWYIVDLDKLPYGAEGLRRREWELFWRDGLPTVGIRRCGESLVS